MADTPHPPVVFDLAEEAATARLARRVAAAEFARAFINARTETPEEVPSPTFTLVQVYDFPAPGGAIPVYHFDLYRIEKASELEELGLDDAFHDGISLIEWPDRMNVFPKNRLDVTLRQGQFEHQRDDRLPQLDRQVF